MTFKISEWVEFDKSGRAICPCCAQSHTGQRRYSKKNLAIVPGTDGAYKCHAGHTPAEIRSALGAAKSSPALIPPPRPSPPPPNPRQIKTYSPVKVKEWQRFLQGSGPTAIAAREWLTNRGITQDLIDRHRLGLRRRSSRNTDGMTYAITIPIPATADGTQWYQTERIAPWDPIEDSQWGYFGCPPTLWFTHKPDTATATWLVAGQWDAMVMGDLIRRSGEAIAVATVTHGEGKIPDEGWERCPGTVTIFYDRDAPGDRGAIRVARDIGDRAKIAITPCPHEAPQGWDVSDAIAAGATLAHFARAAASAQPPPPEKSEPEPAPTAPRPHLRDRLICNDDLIAAAPDVVEFLVPDLLTNNELFLLAAAPRAGKSLLCMDLARSVASGGKFLGRPCTQGNVIYINLEDSPAKIKIREEFQEWGRGLPIWWLEDFKLAELPELIEVAKDLQPSLIIMDTLSRIRDGQITESSAEMSQVIEPLQQFARHQNCAVMVVHHTRKVSAEGLAGADPFDLVRGNSAIRATARGCWLLAQGESSHRLIVEHGHGKHDLGVHLNLARLSWTAIGKWQPAADQTLSDRILAYLNSVGEANTKQIAEALNIHQRSASTVLSRLQVDELIVKIAGGGPKPAIYRRSYNALKVDCSYESGSNPATESVSALATTKNDFSDQENTDQAISSDHFADHLPDHGGDPIGRCSKGKSTSNPEPEPDSSYNVATTQLQRIEATARSLPDPISDQSDQLAIIPDHPDHFPGPRKMITDPSWGDPPGPPC